MLMPVWAARFEMDCSKASSFKLCTPNPTGHQKYMGICVFFTISENHLQKNFLKIITRLSSYGDFCSSFVLVKSNSSVSFNESASSRCVLGRIRTPSPARHVRRDQRREKAAPGSSFAGPSLGPGGRKDGTVT